MTTLLSYRGRFAGCIGGVLIAGLVAGCDENAPSETATTAGSAPKLASGEIGDSGVARKQAQLRFTVEPIGYLFTDGRHRFTQNRRYTESGGVGVTLTKGRVCVDQGQECVEADVTYRINAGEELMQPNYYVATQNVPDRAMIQYWGTDDNGNPISVRTELELVVPTQSLNAN